MHTPHPRRASSTGAARLTVTHASVLAAVLIIAMSGCDVFTPRTPETPTAGGNTLDLPVDPSIVVDNLQEAVRDLNVENYVNSMSEDGYTFIPAGTAPSAFDTWSIAEERTYLNSISLQPGASVRLVLTDTHMEIDGTTSHAVFRADYVLTIPHRRSELDYQTFRGRLLWNLREDPDNLWRLYQWTDQQTGDAPTWSVLKAAFIP